MMRRINITIGRRDKRGHKYKYNHVNDANRRVFSSIERVRE